MIDKITHGLFKEDDREGERRATKRRKSRPWIKRCQRLLNLADILDGIGSVREYQKILPNKPFTNQEIITALNNTFPAEQPLIKHIQETYLNKDYKPPKITKGNEEGGLIRRTVKKLLFIDD